MELKFGRVVKIKNSVVALCLPSIGNIHGIPFGVVKICRNIFAFKELFVFKKKKFPIAV